MDSASGGTRVAGEQKRSRLPKVFISYRHEDTKPTAWALYQPLVAEFGEDNVFFDRGKLRPGDLWLEAIESELAAADAMIVLIGSQWGSILAERMGTTAEEDYVAREIELALGNSAITVIPVLVDDTEPPSVASLPMSIKALPSRQCERMRLDYLLDDAKLLVSRLRGLRGMAGEARVVPTDGPTVDGEFPRRTRIVAPVAELLGDEEPTIPSEPLVAPPPDDEHYEQVVDDNVVVFLGAGINMEDSAKLCDDAGLAEFLAAKVRLRADSEDLAEVAQFAGAIKGEPQMFQWVKEAMGVECKPGPVHRYLARLPRRLEELGLEKRYQMIVTSKYDVALERAFQEVGEPFDVAIYTAPGTEWRGPNDAGRIVPNDTGGFIHIPWRSLPSSVEPPNKYNRFPIRATDSELTRTVIVRINGSVDDGNLSYPWQENFVITEDHYIGYLTGRPAEEIVPAQILAKLRTASYLLLGYAMADWRLRVFLRRLWQGERLGRAKNWAVERGPSRLERELCRDAHVSLYQSSLRDYIVGLDSFLKTRSDEQQRDDEQRM